jgi:hypothetical protein
MALVLGGGEACKFLAFTNGTTPAVGTTTLLEITQQVQTDINRNDDNTYTITIDHAQDESAVYNFIEGAIVTLGEGLGKALGGGDMQGFFDSILQGFGGFIQQMGAMLIAYGVGMEAFKKAFVNPGAAIIAGAALVVIGSAIKAASSHPNVGGGGGAAVSSSVGSSGYGGNSTRTVKLVWQRAGKDLVAIMKEENFSNNTLTGK